MKSATNKTPGGAPLSNPKGMSGGAILSWPTAYEDRASGNGLKLAGIFHTWEKPIHTFCGTRMATVIGLIAETFPQYFERE